MDFWDFDINTIQMKLVVWCYLLARRNQHLDTTVTCAIAQTDGIEMCNIPTLEATKIFQQLHEDLKQNYCNDKARRDKYLLKKVNLELHYGDKEKANTIRNIQRDECCNQCYCNFNFHQGTSITSQEINRIHILMLQNIMEEYKEDDEFKRIDPKKVDKNEASFWKTNNSILDNQTTKILYSSQK